MTIGSYGHKLFALAFLLTSLLMAQHVAAQWQPPSQGQFTALPWAGIGGPGGSSAGAQGAMWADVTDDGRPDLYLTYSGERDAYPDYFYYNNGNLSFSEQASQRDLSDYDGGSHGAAWVDLDNDGDYDIINGGTFWAGHLSSHNGVFANAGGGYFWDASPQSVIDRKYPTYGFVAFDMDRDGDQDLLGISGALGSADPTTERNELYRNDGKFQFTEQTWHPLTTVPAGQNALATDYDNDGDLDLFLANQTGLVTLMRNGGWGNFTQVNPTWIGLQHRAGDGGMGVVSADYDNDNDLDILLCKDNQARLYRNQYGQFTHIRTFSNTAGYMGSFADLNNDGTLDLVFAGLSTIYMNNGWGQFSPSGYAPMDTMRDPRAVAFADIDNDGDLDFVVTDAQQPNALFLNNAVNQNNWIKIKLVSPHGEAGAFGAKVRVYLPNTRTLLGLREARATHGYYAQDEPVLHVGLGRQTRVDVEVTFLNGRVITQKNVSAKQTILVDGTLSQWTSNK